MVHLLGLDEVADQAAGSVDGRAYELARLRSLGLRVPDALILVGAEPELWPSDFDARIAAFKGSSVVVAGQHETILDVCSADLLKKEVENCLLSVGHGGEENSVHAEAVMSIVIQKTVEARVSGVCFTVDPVTNEQNQLVIDSVAGLRETLFSESASPDRDELEKHTGQWAPRRWAGDAPVVSESERAQIAAEALEAERLAGEPLGLEWLIDRDGELYWFHARPTTGLGVGRQSLAAAKRFAAAIGAIDSANGEDPIVMVFRDEEHPKERLQSERASVWVRQLAAEPSEALQLAARAHHLRRWQWPRSDYPAGREGYHAWRRSLAVRHADAVAEILAGVGYSEALVRRVGEIIRKENLMRDPEVQIFEDALCLVFLETQLADFADKHPEEKVVDVILRSLKKMSERGRCAAGKVELGAREQDLLTRAVQRFR